MYKILSYSSILSVLIPFTVGILNLKTFNSALKVLFVYVVVSAATELLSLIFSSYSNQSYFLVQNVFTLLEFLLLILVFYLTLPAKKLRVSLVFISIAYLLLTLYNFIANRSDALADWLTCIECIIFLTLSVYFFYKIQMQIDTPILSGYWFYWYNCGILLYFASSVILFFCGDYLNTCPRKEYEFIWGLHLIGNIIYSCLLAVSLWKAKLK